MLRGSLLFALVLSLLVRPAVAQEVDAAPVPAPADTAVNYAFKLNAGERIRLSLPSAPGHRVTGRLTAMGPSWIEFAPEGQGGAVLNQPLRLLGRIQVAEPPSRVRSALRGAFPGAFLLGGLGLVIGPLTARSTPLTAGESAAAFAGAGMVAGAGIGAIIGAIRNPSRWTTYVFPAR